VTAAQCDRSALPYRRTGSRNYSDKSRQQFIAAAISIGSNRPKITKRQNQPTVIGGYVQGSSNESVTLESLPLTPM